MYLLKEGVEQSVIALWLGHESIETTQIYLDANLELKKKMLADDHTAGRQAGAISARRHAAGVSQEPMSRGEALVIQPWWAISRWIASLQQSSADRLHR